MFLSGKQILIAMTPKKTKKANLEKKKSSFLQLGFIVAISFTLVAFEWSTNEFQSNELASSLNEELSPEIVNEVSFSRPQPIKEKISNNSKSDNSIVIVSDKADDNDEKKKDKVFVEVNTSDFIEEKDNDSIIIEKVKVPRKPFNADSPFFDGILPHYESCVGLNGKEMFDCISDQIKVKFSPDTDNIGTLRFTGNQLVTTTFTVDENGKVSEVYIHGAKKLEKDLLKEVERAIFNLPQMIPGSQGGEPIKARFTLPLNFTLK